MLRSNLACNAPIQSISDCSFSLSRAEGVDGVSSPDSRDGDAPGDEIGDRYVDGDGVDHVSMDIAVTVSAAVVVVTN